MSFWKKKKKTNLVTFKKRKLIIVTINMVSQLEKVCQSMVIIFLLLVKLWFLNGAKGYTTLISLRGFSFSQNNPYKGSKICVSIFTSALHQR